MSWHYLQGPVEGCWDRDSLDGAPPALLRLIPTADPSCSPGKEMGTLSHSRSGTTSKRSTGARGPEQLTLFQEASRAKISAQQVKVEAFPEIVQAFGLKCCELLERYGLVLSSQKIRRICALEDLPPSSKDLPNWGMTADGVCWALGTSVRRMNATAYGLLQKWPTPRAIDVPSIKTRDVVKVAPTGPCTISPSGHLYRPSLTSTAIYRADPTLSRGVPRGRVCPKFREWLMGWPINWTAKKPLAMDRFQRWLRLHGVV